MKIPFNWLKDFVEIDYSPAELAEMLTMVGLEVEEITKPFSYLEDVIIGRINLIKTHPNANKLKVCYVCSGDKKYEIVCGAANIKEGVLVPLALPGCSLPSGLTVEEVKIRGVKSEGMLCSQKELGLGDDHSGIWLFSADFPIGTTLAGALCLNDTVLEVAITPNRGDCLSVLGVAREVAAITRKRLHYPQLNPKEVGISILETFKVTIEHPKHCFRYIARLIRDIELKSSPLWMQARLLLAGIRPINNIVDITNYVMWEYGQPLHAFDAKKVSGRHIIVRLAYDGEKLITLDEKQHCLNKTDLVICDKKGPIALAGIMGGLGSEIDNKTKKVFLESAYFNPITIRQTAKRLGIMTEASYRFEREVDPEASIEAAQAACYFMQTIAKAKVAPHIIDVYPAPKPLRSIYVPIGVVKQTLGLDIAKKEIIDILERLEIKVKDLEDRLELTPPSFRHDLVRDVDFIEEVARLYGYENIPSIMPAVCLEAKPIFSYMGWREKIKDILCGLGWHEIINYAFIDTKSLDKLNLPKEHPLRQVIKPLNPISEDRAWLRSTLVPGLLDTADYNQRHRIYHFSFFELGKVFIPIANAPLPEERFRLGGIASGYRFAPSWHFHEEPIDFYDIKGTIETVLDTLGIEAKFKRAEDICYLTPSNATYIVKEEKKIGYLGEIHPQVKEAWDLKNAVLVFELDLDILWVLRRKETKFKSLPKFPPTERDVALVVPISFLTQTIKDFVLSLHVPYIENIELIDVYQGLPIADGKKGLTYRLTYRAWERTLTDQEVDKLHKNIVSNILKTFKIEVRQ
jgi:phenylalanyl-tRNA synthetase beta chain